MSRHADRLVRLDDRRRILSREESLALAQRVCAAAQGGGETRVHVGSWWQGELRWARNRVSLAGDRRDVFVSVQRILRGAMGANNITNQLDDVSLEAVVRSAERTALRGATFPAPPVLPPAPPWAAPPPGAVWSDATYDLTAEARGEAARALIDPAEAKGLLSAGYLEVRAGSHLEVSSARPAGEYAVWDHPYAAWTHAQCSMTVRDPKGTGSGWAGLSAYDWAKVDSTALAQRALEKCVASQNPVSLEPGRYVVILEPQAVCDLLNVLVRSLRNDDREEAEQRGSGPFVLGPDEALGILRTKLGLKVVDERVTISHDLADPALGIVPAPGRDPGPVTWIDRGVLTVMPHRRTYALQQMNDPLGVRPLTGYRMSGGETSVEEMLATTKRGLLVTRFSNIRLLDDTSLLSTGLTRDGLWLVQNGKVSKAVKNFRFTESPLFVLNSLEQLGVPVPVFRPTVAEWGVEKLTPAIVPPLKARDFSFTSTIDAV